MSILFRRLVLTLSLLGFFLPARGADAQPQDQRATARSAATSGLKAFQAGRYREAITFFERAESAAPAPQHQLFIARSQVKLKKLVLAADTYRKIVSETQPPGASQAARDTKAVAQQELAELEPRIPLLTVTLKGDEGQPVRVTLDGVELPNSVIGVSRPVDPGSHELMAVGGDRTSLPVKLTLQEGARETVVLELVPHANGTTPPVPIQARPPGLFPTAPAQSYGRDPGRDSGGDGLKIAGYTALGVGIAGLATGTVFALRSHSKRSEADELCGDETCPVSRRAEIDPLYEDARSAETVSTVGFITGGLGIGTAAVLFILNGRDERATSSAVPPLRNRTRTGVKPVLGLGSVGVSGRF